MAYNHRQVATLLTAAELELFDASLAAADLTPAELRSAITRARRLRDKQRDLLQRQRLASRASTGAKGGRTGVANRRTADKAKALDETLARLEKRAALLAKKAEAEARREAAKRAAAIRKAAKSKSKAKSTRSKAAGTPRSNPARRGAAEAPGPKTAISKKARFAPAKAGPALPGTRDPSAAKRLRANVGRTRAVSKRNQARRDAR